MHRGEQGVNAQQVPTPGAAHVDQGDKGEGCERVVCSGLAEVRLERLAASEMGGEVKREVKEELRTGVEAEESLLHAVKKKKKR